MKSEYIIAKFSILLSILLIGICILRVVIILIAIIGVQFIVFLVVRIGLVIFGSIIRFSEILNMNTGVGVIEGRLSSLGASFLSSRPPANS